MFFSFPPSRTRAHSPSLLNPEPRALIHYKLPNEPILEVQPEENEPVSAPTDEPISNPVVGQADSLPPTVEGCPKNGSL